MKLKAEFGEVKLEIESDNQMIVAQYYASWYGLVKRVIDEEAEMPDLIGKRASSDDNGPAMH